MCWDSSSSEFAAKRELMLWKRFESKLDGLILDSEEELKKQFKGQISGEIIQRKTPKEGFIKYYIRGLGYIGYECSQCGKSIIGPPKIATKNAIGLEIKKGSNEFYCRNPECRSLISWKH